MADKRELKIYGSYRFKDKDPVIAELRTLVEKHYGKVNYAALKDIEKGGGPSTSCMAAWFFGETVRPTSPTVEAAGRSIGWKRVWRRM